MILSSVHPAASMFGALLIAATVLGQQPKAPQQDSAALAAQAAEFSAERNREIDRSISMVATARAQARVEAERQAEADRSIAAVEATRRSAFALARNEEAERSIARVLRARAMAMQAAEIQTALRRIQDGKPMPISGAIAVFERLASLR